MLRNAFNTLNALKVLILSAFIGTVFCGSAYALSDLMSDRGILILYAQNFEGDLGLATVAWEALSPKERAAFRRDAGRILQINDVAKKTPLPEDVATSLEWTRARIVAEMWMTQTARETDLSDAALRSFYEANRSRYMHEERVKYARIVCGSESDARLLYAQLNAPNALFANLARDTSLDATSAKAGGDMGWAERSELDEPLADLLFSAPLGTPLMPVRLQDEWIIYQVEAKEPAVDYPYESCIDEVRKDALEQAVLDRLPK